MFFASGKAHAEMIRDEVRSRGVSCEMVMGDTPKAERAHLIKTYKEQGIRAMVSVGVLTTGFDAPHVDLIALMRPTMSPGLYVQIVGRGLRKCEGKTNCLVLDFAGNIERHGPLDDIKVKEPGQGNGEAPIKACPQCDELVPAGALVCACCGFEFPPREIVKHQSRASYLAVVSDDDGPSDRPSLPVQSMRIARHKKVGKKDSVRVSYNINMSLSISEWLCFDHGVYMNKKAQEVWAKLGGFKPLPATTEEALERKGELMTPSHIQVSQQGKYERVEDRIFKKPEPPAGGERVEISESDIPF